MASTDVAGAMKVDEIRPCALCGKGVMHAGLPLFWRVTCECMGIDMAAVRRTTGLEMLTGSVALARAMGPDPDIATPLGDARTIVVCESCAGAQTSVYRFGLEG